MYGVEIHATVIGNLLEQSWISHFDHTYTVSLIVLISSLIFLILISLSQAHLLILFGMIGLSVINYLLFSWGKIWVGGLAVLWLVALSSISISILWRLLFLRDTK